MRKVLEHLGLKVNRLIRFSFGPFQLGDLDEGAIEEVKTPILRERSGRGLPRRPARISTRRWRMSAPRPVALRRSKASLEGRGRASSVRRGRGAQPQDDEPEQELVRARTEQRREPPPRRPSARPAAARPERNHARSSADACAGARIAGPKSDAVRPTADRLRESLFNILMHAYGDPVSGARVLDLFAGTGALGIEAISRGAAFALFVDDGVEARALFRAEYRDAGARWRHPHLPARRDQARPGASAGAVLAGLPRPALRKGLAEKALASAREGGWLKPDALVVVEEAAEAGFAAPEGFEELERRDYDDTEFVFLRA